MKKYQSENIGSGSLRLQRTHDVIGGVVLIAVAVLALWLSRNLPGAQGFSLGPGTAPRLVAWFLLICGVGVVVSDLRGEVSDIPSHSIRGPFFVILAIGVFACSIEPLGLVLASYLTFTTASLGSTEARFLETLIVGTGLALFCGVLFLFGLHLPFDLWPAFMR